MFAVDSAWGAIGGLLGLLLYFVPSIVAAARRMKNPAPLVVINVFLGWTFVGWVVALAWAVGGQTVPRAPLPPRPIEPIPRLPEP